MSKSRPDADKLANEFAGASAFFRSQARPADEPMEPEPAVTPQPEPTPVPEKEPVRDVMTSRRPGVMTSPDAAETDRFDINRPTASRDSLRLSMDETRALDELRSTLKWDYDLTVTKNDICRVALHALLEEYRAKGERSSAITRLKRKQTSR
jgi:hypothetical protein